MVPSKMRLQMCTRTHNTKEQEKSKPYRTIKNGKSLNGFSDDFNNFNNFTKKPGGEVISELNLAELSNSLVQNEDYSCDYYFMITECVGQGYVYGLHGLRLWGVLRG